AAQPLIGERRRAVAPRAVRRRERLTDGGRARDRRWGRVRRRGPKCRRRQRGRSGQRDGYGEQVLAHLKVASLIFTVEDGDTRFVGGDARLDDNLRSAYVVLTPCRDESSSKLRESTAGPDRGRSQYATAGS